MVSKQEMGGDEAWEGEEVEALVLELTHGGE